jgi:hypothetical protein
MLPRHVGAVLVDQPARSFPEVRDDVTAAPPEVVQVVAAAGPAAVSGDHRS